MCDEHWLIGVDRIVSKWGGVMISLKLSNSINSKFIKYYRIGYISFKFGIKFYKKEEYCFFHLTEPWYERKNVWVIEYMLFIFILYLLFGVIGTQYSLITAC